MKYDKFNCSYKNSRVIHAPWYSLRPRSLTEPELKFQGRQRLKTFVSSYPVPRMRVNKLFRYMSYLSTTREDMGFSLWHHLFYLLETEVPHMITSSCDHEVLTCVKYLTCKITSSVICSFTYLLLTPFTGNTRPMPVRGVPSNVGTTSTLSIRVSIARGRDGHTRHKAYLTWNRYSWRPPVSPSVPLEGPLLFGLQSDPYPDLHSTPWTTLDTVARKTRTQRKNYGSFTINRTDDWTIRCGQGTCESGSGSWWFTSPTLSTQRFRGPGTETLDT